MVVSRSVDGQPLRMIGTHSDISLRRQTERLEQFRSHVLDWLTQGKPCRISCTPSLSMPNS